MPFSERKSLSTSPTPLLLLDHFLFSIYNQAYKSKEFQGCSNDLADHLTCSTVIDHQRITKENKSEQKRKTTLKLKISTMMKTSREDGT